MNVVTKIDRSERIHRVDASDFELHEASGRDAQAFHRVLPGYAPSNLAAAPGIAAKLGLEQLWVKDESSRMGLPAFKIMGASWAVYKAAVQEYERRFGRPIQAWTGFDELVSRFSPLSDITLTCATDGNHGRAVARMAAWLGFRSRIFVPHDMAASRIEAIRSEGAEIVVFAGTYDEAVATSAATAGPDDLVISDTSWPGYEEVPAWVIQGYSTIMAEIDDELEARGESSPDVVAVQIGVGALAASVVRHWRQPGVSPRPVILGVEPTHAACAMHSIEAGEVVELPGPHDSIMAGLNCGIPSPLAWPVVSRGIDAFITVGDERARDAVRSLHAEGIVAGECGSAGLAGLIAYATRYGGDLRGKRALVISTEGATDPEAYARIIAGGH